MNTVRRLMTVVLDIAFFFLAMNALLVVLMFIVNPLIGGGHGHWVVTGFAAITAIALRTFIWLLPAVAVMFLIGSLMSSDRPATDQR